MSAPSCRRLLRGLALIALGILAGCDPQGQPSGQAQPPAAPADPHEVIQTFPSSLPPEGNQWQTAWRVRWDHATSKGLFLTGAWFKRSPKEPWYKVLGDTRVSDIFVPYHGYKVPGFENTRFWDLSTAEYQFELKPATPQDAGPNGKLLGDPPVVVKEVRDRGLIWKEPSTGVSRRGEEMVLWGTMRASNYAYVFQYGFRDDGTITCRLGATGQNYPHAPLESHVHNALWRIDIDLGDPNHNTVYLMRHLSPKPGGTLQQSADLHEAFGGGKEGFADWNPEEFTHLQVVDARDTSVNYMGDHWSYDLMPLRTGSARYRATEYEKCTLHDFYVTRSRHADGREDHETDFKLLPQYLDGESIINTDVVLWYISSAHHEPRSEDGRFVKDDKGGYRWQGITHLMWAGFDLMPRNLFDGTPLYDDTGGSGP